MIILITTAIDISSPGSLCSHCDLAHLQVDHGCAVEPPKQDTNGV
jgi:hypothetical protein